MIRPLLILLILFALALPVQAQTSGVTIPPCDAARHGRYTAMGPDGVLYPTWHPQIEARFGLPCFFDHEHGSDPALFDPAFAPLYGYTARGMPEGHAGFKGYAFTVAGVSVYITQHMGTTSPHVAACARYHTFDVAMRDSAGLLADLHVMGEYGSSRINTTNAVYTPPGCTPQDYSTAFYGVRLLPIASDFVGYEPWRVNTAGNVVGLNSANLTINTKNPVAMCNDATCSASVPTGANGTWREVSSLPGFGVTGVVSGTFTTDMHATGPGDTQQYIRPGASVSLPQLRCYPYGDPFAYIYVCNSSATAWGNPKMRNPFVTGAN